MIWSAPPPAPTPLAAATAQDEVSPAPGRRRRHRRRGLLGELARFGAVGAVAFVVDTGLFNLLRYGPGEVLAAKPITAKVISVTVATIVAWLGNRYWTFAAHRTSSRGRELVFFAAVNVGGMLIAVGCLGLSHYVLGLTSPLADNVSANVVGLALGTAFRYVAYRWLVFTGDGLAGDGLAGDGLPREDHPERHGAEHHGPEHHRQRERHDGAPAVSEGAA